MSFLGDILIGIFLAAATTALVSPRHRRRAQVVAGVSLLLFVVLITRHPVRHAHAQLPHAQTSAAVSD